MYTKPVSYRNHMVANLDVSQHRPDEVAARRDAHFERFERRLVEYDHHYDPSMCTFVSFVMMQCIMHRVWCMGDGECNRADETAKRRLKEKQDRTNSDIEKRCGALT